MLYWDNELSEINVLYVQLLTSRVSLREHSDY